MRTPGAGRETALFRIAAAILILNLLDAILTLTAVGSGVASEANPLMEAPLGWGAVWFILVKISVVSLGVLLLWRARRSLLAVCGLVGLFLVYVAVLAHHASAFDLVASHLT